MSIRNMLSTQLIKVTTMLKTDMTPEQLKRRDFFINRLLAAGWDPGGWELLFEHGADLSPEAQAEYENPALSLRLSYFVEQGYVLLESVSKETSEALSVRFYPKDNLTTVVDILVEVQDRLAPDRYTGLIGNMIPVCEAIVLETPDGLVKVS